MSSSNHTILRGKNVFQNNEGGRPDNTRVKKVDIHYLHTADRIKTRPDNKNIDLTRMFDHHLNVDRPNNNPLNMNLAVRGLENRDLVQGGSFSSFFRGLGHGIEKGLGIASKVAPILPFIL